MSKPAKKKPVPMPVDRIEVWPLLKLLPSARNARTHAPEQIEQIAASMKEFGQTMPILVDERGEIIAGHGRALAAERLGLTEVRVAVASGWTKAQRTAYRLLDNRLAENSSWDESLLKIDLTELSKADFDVALTGFTASEVKRLLSEDAVKVRTRISIWPLDKLLPYANNARVHSPEQVDQIAASMKEWGWTNPVLVDEEGNILAGYGRIQAAKKLGLTEAPVLVASGWTEAQKRAYMIADNQLALNASWSIEALSSELKSIDDFDLTLVGFDPATLSWMVAEGEVVTDPAGEWGGMPGFDQKDKTGFRTLIVHFNDQAAVDAFAKVIGQEFGPKTRSIWYPKAPIERYVDKQYVAGEVPAPEEAAA